MTILSDDERMLLQVLAGAGKPIRLDDVMQQLMPPRPDGPEWYGQSWWGRQWCATAKNWIDLRKAGMFEPVAGGGYVLTDAGRDALAGRQRPRSAFWDDLNRNLERPKFRRTYIAESLRIQAFDEQINTGSED